MLETSRGVLGTTITAGLAVHAAFMTLSILTLLYLTESIETLPFFFPQTLGLKEPGPGQFELTWGHRIIL